MRVLTFDAKNDQHRDTFKLLVTAIRSGDLGDADQSDATLKTRRKLLEVGVEKRVQTKDDAGRPVFDDFEEPVMRSVYRLADDGGTVELEDAEFDELKRRVNLPGLWHADAIEKVSAAREFLKAAPTEKKVPARRR